MVESGAVRGRRKTGRKEGKQAGRRRGSCDVCMCACLTKRLTSTQQRNPSGHQCRRRLLLSGPLLRHPLHLQGGWPIEFPDSLPPSLPFTFTCTFKRRLPRHLCLPSPLHLDKLATAAPTTTIPLVYNFLRGRRAQHVACPEVAPQQQGGPIIPLLRRSACSLTSRARPPPQPRACV